MAPARPLAQITALLTVALLSACGGGGDGGGGGSLAPLEYSGNTNAAVVSPTNASTLVDDLLGESDAGQAILANGSSTTLGAGQFEGHAGLARRLRDRLGDAVVQAERVNFAQRPAAGAFPVDETEPCASGTVRRAGTLNDNGTGVLTITFNQCSDGELTLAGQATVRVDAFDLGVFLPTDFTVSFTRITLRGSGISVDTGGSLRAQLSIAARTETLVENVVELDNLRGTMTKSQNLVFVSLYDNLFSPSSISTTLTGRLFDSVHGFVDVTTTVPVSFGSVSQLFPHAGEVRLLGGASRSVRVTARSTLLVLIGLDLDGDGSFETTATLAWLDLRRPAGRDLRDSDGDGMHDAWETANGLSPMDPADAALDNDGDGATNLAEYQAGTDPNNAGSVPPPPPPLTFSGLVVSLASVSDLAYDPVTQRLYAAVATNPGTVVPIDPTNGSLGTAIAVGNSPAKLALSDNGQYLYVGLQGDPSVQRIDLSTQSADLSIPLGSDSFFGPFYADDMAVLPGSPGSIAVSLKVPGISPRHQGVAIFDGAVRRTNTTPTHTGSNVIEFSASAGTLYGYNNETTGFGFYRMSVDANGVSVLDVFDSFDGNLISGFGVDIRFAGGVIYTSSGRAVDPVGLAVLGTFALTTSFANAVAADAAVGRVFYLTGSGAATRLRAYDRTSFASLSAVNVPGVLGDARSLVRWGAKGLAFRTTGGQVFITEQAELIP